MKKKILSFLLGIFMTVSTLVSLTSCSLVKKDDSVKNNKVVLKIGDTSLTRSDIINSFYTYYQNNSSYFAYYEEDVIEDSFYQWAIVRQMLSDKSLSALAGKEEVQIYYTKKDAKEVWDKVLDYVYEQVGTYEKSIYELKGYEASNYPTWIKTEEEKKEDSLFAPYEKTEIEIGTNKVTEENPSVEKLTKEQVVDLIYSNEENEGILKYLFQYETEEVDEDGNKKRVSIDETNYIPNARNQAYTNYVSALVSSAKSNGTSTDANVCLENEIYRVYEAYYNSQVTTIFQNYYLNEYLSNYDADGDGKGDYYEEEKAPLSDSLIVKAFLEEYYTQKQIYSSEKGYIDVVTSTDGAPLILYSYNGQNYFFSVQHILVKFSSYLEEQVKALEGYNSASGTDYDALIGEMYKTNRDNLAKDYNQAMLTPVNEKNEFSSIDIEGCYNYYYYDETQKEVYDTDKKIYNGYILLTRTETGEGDDLVVTYTDASENSDYDAEAVEKFATVEDILNAYDKNFAEWKNIVKDYYDGVVTRETVEEKNEDMLYVYDTVMNMKEAGKELDVINEKIASYLFVQIQWIYSTDSLGNALSNKIGYIISNYEDENGSWVADFAIGARELARDLEDGKITFRDKDGNVTEEITIEKLIEDNRVSDLTTTIISDYGYHIIKVENVYTQGTSISNLEEVIADLIEDENEISYEDKETVAALAKFLKENYVAAASNQTLYDYFYDLIYTEYVGSGNSRGTYFLDLEYKWLSEMYGDGDIQFIERIGYKELMENIT